MDFSVTLRPCKYNLDRWSIFLCEAADIIGAGVGEGEGVAKPRSDGASANLCPSADSSDSGASGSVGSTASVTGVVPAGRSGTSTTAPSRASADASLGAGALDASANLCVSADSSDSEAGGSVGSIASVTGVVPAGRNGTATRTPGRASADAPLGAGALDALVNL